MKFAKLICHLPNAISQKKASHLVCSKKPQYYVGEIDPWYVLIRKNVKLTNQKITTWITFQKNESKNILQNCF
jgi:hypothetical protein